MDIHSSNQNPLKFRLERLARWPLTQPGDKYLGLDTVAGSSSPAPVSGGTNMHCEGAYAHRGYRLDVKRNLPHDGQFVRTLS